jgi:hypothetical protein
MVARTRHRKDGKTVMLAQTLYFFNKLLSSQAQRWAKAQRINLVSLTDVDVLNFRRRDLGKAHGPCAIAGSI